MTINKLSQSRIQFRLKIKEVFPQISLQKIEVHKKKLI